MTYTAPSTVTAGQTYTATAHNVIVNDIIDHEERINAVEVPFRNLIINGAMKVDQRKDGASTTSDGIASADRWGLVTSSAAGQLTRQRISTVAPSGFQYSLKHTISASGAYTPSAAQSTYIYQSIEGYTAAKLLYGSASAKTVTVSFWVRSSVTGTYGVSIQQSGTSQAIVQTYTISAADTWEYKTLTFAGNTSGTWSISNSAHSYLNFALAAGTNFQTTAGSWGATGGLTTSSQTQWTNTANATFYLTGVQMEIGSTATDYAIVPYDMELRQCQRYLYFISDGSNSPQPLCVSMNYSSTTAYGIIPFPVRMRTTPDIYQTGGTNYFAWEGNGTTIQFNSFNLSTTSAIAAGVANNGGLTGLTVGQAGWFVMNNTAARLGFVAEM